MGVVFNPLIFEGLDFTGVGSTGPASRYSQPFNSLTDWGVPSGGVYTITITAAIHGKTDKPTVTVYEDIGSGNFQKLEVNNVKINSVGDVSVSVLSTPDLRFPGLIVII